LRNWGRRTCCALSDPLDKYLVDVESARDRDQRAFRRSPDRFDDAGVVVSHQVAHRRLGGDASQVVEKFFGFLPQGEHGRKKREVLALGDPLDPPELVVLSGEAGDRLAGPRQVIELAALLRLPDLALDPRLESHFWGLAVGHSIDCAAASADVSLIRRYLFELP
jgi:hypothetical protein